MQARTESPNMFLEMRVESKPHQSLLSRLFVEFETQYLSKTTNFLYKDPNDSNKVNGQRFVVQSTFVTGRHLANDSCQRLGQS